MANAERFDISSSLGLKPVKRIESTVTASNLHISGLIIMDGDVFAYQVEKPFLIFDVKSYVSGLIEAWSEDRMEYALTGDKSGMSDVATLMNQAEAWFVNPASAPPNDLHLQLRLTRAPLRVGSGQLTEYLRTILAQPYSLLIPPPSVSADGLCLQEEIPREYIPQFVIIADHKPHPLFIATSKLRAAIRNSGNEIDSQLVTEDDLMKIALPHILTARNLADRLITPRISPRQQNDDCKKEGKNSKGVPPRVAGKAKRRAPIFDLEEISGSDKFNTPCEFIAQ